MNERRLAPGILGLEGSLRIGALPDARKIPREGRNGNGYLRKKFEMKNHTFAGRSARRRMKYGYHSVP
jgi:hypothetical protein